VAEQYLVFGRKRHWAGEFFEWIAVLWHAKPFASAAPPPDVRKGSAFPKDASWTTSSTQVGRLSLPACVEEDESCGLGRKAGGFPQNGAAELH
jgi:hypothetical protein